MVAVQKRVGFLYGDTLLDVKGERGGGFYFRHDGGSSSVAHRTRFLLLDTDQLDGSSKLPTLVDVFVITEKTITSGGRGGGGGGKRNKYP